METRFSRKKFLLLPAIFILVLATTWFSYGFAVAELTPSSTTENLFVYGTLKSPLIRLYACRCITHENTAVLSGYKRVGLNIVPDSSSVVNGKLLQVTPLELERLDIYENTPDKYRRTKIELNSGKNAWVYVR